VFNVVMPSVDVPNVIMLSTIILSVRWLSVTTLSVLMIGAMAPSIALSVCLIKFYWEVNYEKM
jgi:hypothetical protein